MDWHRLEYLVELKEKEMKDIVNTLKDLKSKKRKVEDLGERLVQVRVLLQDLGAKIQEGVKKWLENVVSLALKSILNEDLDFVVEFLTRKNKVETEFYVRKGNFNLDPLSCGGGIVDVISFALRIAVWGVRKWRNIFFLDEPFKNLSDKGGNLERCARFLKELCEQMGVKFVIVSHNEKFIEYLKDLENVKVVEV